MTKSIAILFVNDGYIGGGCFGKHHYVIKYSDEQELKKKIGKIYDETLEFEESSSKEKEIKKAKDKKEKKLQDIIDGEKVTIIESKLQIINDSEFTSLI